MANGLFGPTPAEIQASMADERLQRAALLSNIPIGGLGGAIAGQLFGQAANTLLGAQDPRLTEATALQEIEQEVNARGLQPGTREFTEFTVNALRMRGLERKAMEASILGRQLEGQEAQVRGQVGRARKAEADAAIAEAIAPFAATKAEGQAIAAQADATRKALIAQNTPEELANEAALRKAQRQAQLASAFSSQQTGRAAAARADRTRNAIKLDNLSAAGKMEDDQIKRQREYFADANKLLDDFSRDTQVMAESQDSWNRFQALARQGGGAADVGMLVAYTKMLDPGSVAREGEVAAVANSISGFLGRVAKQIQSTGTTRVVLTDRERTKLIDAARAMASSNEQSFRGIVQRYEQIGQRAGIAPQDFMTRQVQSITPPAGTGTGRRIRFNAQGQRIGN